MLMGLLLGLPVMVRHHYLVNSPSFVASLIVINGVMLLLVIPRLWRHCHVGGVQAPD